MYKEKLWTLERKYFSDGTNGSLWSGSQLICHTIELPWRDNQRKISCIPEGKYPLRLYQSMKFGTVLMVTDVLNRQDILFHPANNAMDELQGCIAPVMVHTGEGKGLKSQVAMQQMMKIAGMSLQRKQDLFLLIHTKQ